MRILDIFAGMQNSLMSPERLFTPGELPMALLYVFFAFAFIQLLYFLIFFLRLARFRDTGKGSREPGVSVVICAHNEYYNLKANLPLILQQDYPEYEVLVVNHASDDETVYLLSDLQREYPRLKSISIREDLNFFSGKKFPLSIGIRSAKYERILLTDADCKPASSGWIRSMQSAYSENTKIVLGYSPYQRSGGILNRLIRFDTAHIASQYLSFALAGLPYMGVGRNLSYNRSLFYDNKGFISHYRISSGDDDLFINRVAKASNTAVCLNPGSFVFTEPKKRFGQWITQKRRHVSTSVHYRFIHKFLLGLYAFSQAGFWVMFILMLSLNFSLFPVLAVFCLRTALQLSVLAGCFRKLGEKDLILFIPLLEILILLINACIGAANIIRRPSRWK
jgi:glycosyltransferase involved in cell wall biosynthesis